MISGTLNLPYFRLSSKLGEASKNKEVISGDIKSKREHLENLQPKLKAILQVRKLYIISYFPADTHNIFLYMKVLTGRW